MRRQARGSVLGPIRATEIAPCPHVRVATVLYHNGITLVDTGHSQRQIMFNYDASPQSLTTVSVSVLVLTLFIVVPSAFTLSIVLHDMCDGGGVVVAAVVHDFHDKIRLLQQRVVPHARTTAKCPSCEVK